MARVCVIDRLNLKRDANPAAVEEYLSWLVEEWIPMLLEDAPGLLSCELVERRREPIPHLPDDRNRASDLAWVEFWESAEANHRWWGGGMTERVNKALRRWFQIQGDVEVSFYTVIE